MANAETLTLAFVNAHPAEAARILERLNPVDAAALFERVPARAGAPVLNAMLPTVAARILTELQAGTAQSLLAVIGTQAAVSILRQIAEPQRSELVATLPTAAAMASRLLLHYPNDSVGAWIDPDIVVFPPGTTVSEALARISEGNEPQVELVFSVDHDQRLAGVTTLHNLLRAAGDRKLASIATAPPVVLTGIATVNGVARRRGWQQTSVLPVTDRNGKPIGVLRRGALDRALARANRQLPTDNSELLVSMFASGYWNAFSALAHAVVSLLPGAKSITSDKS